jgi:D-alanine transaminase
LLVRHHVQQFLTRLQHSLDGIRLGNPHTDAEWASIIIELVARQPFDDQGVYFQVTRGVAPRDHVMPAHPVPTVFMMSNPMKPPGAELRHHGVAAVTARDFRWERGDIKSTSLLGAVFSRQISFDAGATETVMFRDGYLSEAAASNVWVVKDGQLLGTPKDNLVLEGIRYGLIEELCKQQGIGFELRRISRAEVLQADELLLTSASKEVLAITSLDGKAVGNGRPGPVGERLYAGYQLAKQASRTAVTTAA